VSIGRPMIFKLEVENLPVWILAEPGDSVDIEISIEQYRESINGLKIECRDKEAITLYNKMMIVPYRNFSEIDELFSNGIAKGHNIIDLVKRSINSKLSEFAALHKKGLLRKSIFELIRIKLEASIINQAIRRMDESKEFISVTPQSERDSLQEILFSVLNPLDTNLNMVDGTEFYQYKYANFLYHKYLLKHFEIKAADSLIKIDDNRFFLLSRFFVPLLFLPDLKIRQNVWAKWLYIGYEVFRDKLYKDDYSIFLSLFPLSEYNDIFSSIENESNKLIQHQVAGDSTTRHIKFLESETKIKTIKKLQSFITADYIYVDIWATWCMPCRQEFLTSKWADSVFEQHSIAKVYISIDGVGLSLGERNEIIYKYNLQGYHLIAGPHLLKDLKTKIFRSRTFSIPRYFLLQSNGEIVEPDAPTPSNHAGLLDLLRKNKIIE
jgi:thiol-disulfide isomerase/thioredoxin